MGPRPEFRVLRSPPTPQPLGGRALSYCARAGSIPDCGSKPRQPSPAGGAFCFCLRRSPPMAAERAPQPDAVAVGVEALGQRSPLAAVHAAHRPRWRLHAVLPGRPRPATLWARRPVGAHRRGHHRALGFGHRGSVAERLPEVPGQVLLDDVRQMELALPVVVAVVPAQAP